MDNFRAKTVKTLFREQYLSKVLNKQVFLAILLTHFSLNWILGFFFLGTCFVNGFNNYSYLGIYLSIHFVFTLLYILYEIAFSEILR